MKKQDYQKRALYRALNKYKPDNFTFDVIDYTYDSNELCELEKYYIAKFRTYVRFDDCNGYNETLGGDGRCHLNLDETDVIRVYNSNNVIETTAKYFNCDFHVIKNILLKNGIHTFTAREQTRRKFIEKYGGLVQMSMNHDEIIYIFECPADVYKKYDDYKEKGLHDAYRLNSATHRYKGYTWYRLNELPDKYKPLLDEYYRCNSDNI